MEGMTREIDPWAELPPDDPSIIERIDAQIDAALTEAAERIVADAGRRAAELRHRLQCREGEEEAEIIQAAAAKAADELRDRGA